MSEQERFTPAESEEFKNPIDKETMTRRIKNHITELYSAKKELGDILDKANDAMKPPREYEQRDTIDSALLLEKCKEQYDHFLPQFQDVEEQLNALLEPTSEDETAFEDSDAEKHYRQLLEESDELKHRVRDLTERYWSSGDSDGRGGDQSYKDQAEADEAKKKLIDEEISAADDEPKEETK
ncbi:MAG: hypothetical protein Q7K33_02840 [Candidatus Berkelbacteria bacterium]|nr:hypothetical protein [Candidatus Berkelbacteria bacterium]